MTPILRIHLIQGEFRLVGPPGARAGGCLPRIFLIDAINIYQYQMFALNLVGRFSTAKRRLDGGTLLEEWQLLPGGPTTQLREVDDSFWLSNPGIGAIQFDVSSRSISAYPQDGVDTSMFERALVHEWLPVIYQAWGRQVLHASGALHLASGVVVAFAGVTGTGKSTLGYGLGQRPGWRQIADDSLAFKITGDRVRLLSIPNVVRLRPASAKHYGQQAYSLEMLDWPDINLGLDYVFFVEKNGESEYSPGSPGRVVPISGVQTLPLLLQHAYALTLKLPEHNKRLLRDYLRLARQVAAFRLLFQRSFTALDETLNVVERQVR